MTSGKNAKPPEPERRSGSGDPFLLTPGPLTTSLAVKQAMLHDLGSRDQKFVAVNARIRERLLALAGSCGEHVCVPIQGSGTFAVEAMIGSLVPADGKLLNLVNGAYGRRITRICAYANRNVTVLEAGEAMPVNPAEVDEALSEDRSVTHVCVVHCETTSGVLNPLETIARVVAAHGRLLLVDAMSGFGALPVNAADVPFAALAASSNKCLEGVPGVAFCIVRRDLIEASRGRARALSLDLHDQWQAMEGNGQWRFTPPTHVLLALEQALVELDDEGGAAGRHRRYSENCRILVDGMRALGFQTFLDDACQAPVIVTFHQPRDPAFQFERFYALLEQRGFVIYPGKLTGAATFRIGCIGRIGAADMQAAVAAVGAVIGEMGISDFTPA